MTSGRARPRVAVIDYGIGNLRSAAKALVRVGADAYLTSDPGEVERADGVVLPGVGAFGRAADAMRSLGLTKAASRVIETGKPFLGICVGMQLLFEKSEESPGVRGLGVLSGEVVRLPAEVKVPQMQWNLLERVGSPAMLDGVPDPVWVYFVHSYVPDVEDGVVAFCDYGRRFPAAVEAGNVWATQFHPEKSGRTGLEMLGRFVRRCEERL